MKYETINKPMTCKLRTNFKQTFHIWHKNYIHTLNRRFTSDIIAGNVACGDATFNVAIILAAYDNIYFWQPSQMKKKNIIIIKK